MLENRMNVANMKNTEPPMAFAMYGNTAPIIALHIQLIRTVIDAALVLNFQFWSLIIA